MTHIPKSSTIFQSHESLWIPYIITQDVTLSHIEPKYDKMVRFI